MSVSKPPARLPINRQATKTGRINSRKSNVSQSPRPSSYGGGKYNDTTPSETYFYEDNSGGYESNDCGYDSGSSDSSSCGSE